MARRFTLAGLLLWTTFVGLALAFVVPLWRDLRRQNAGLDAVVFLAASADGSTFAALMGDRRVLVWDSAGNLKAQVKPPATVGGKLALSFDGSLLAFSPSDNDLFATSTSGQVEIWNVDTGKRRRSLPRQLNDVRFSPTHASFIALGSAGIYAPRAVDDESPPVLLAAIAEGAAFSPNGKTIAVLRSNGIIELYDAVTSRLAKAKKLASKSAVYTSHCGSVWAPDGRSILATTFSVARGGAAGKASATHLADRWYVDTGDVRHLPADELSIFAALAYLPGNSPGDSPRLITTNHSGLTVLDAETLQRLPVDTADYSEFAVGLRGDAFVAASDNSVDLLDAATLKPRRRLIEAPSPPSPVPFFVGLFIWFIAFGLHKGRQSARLCQTCGQRFNAAGKKDANVECPACRQKAQNQRLTPGEAARADRRQMRGAWIALLAFDAALAAGFGFLTRRQFGFWPPFAIAAIGLPAAVFGLLYWWVKRKFRRAITPEEDVALAEESAGGTGTVRQMGDLFVWSAPGTSLAEMLAAEVETIRGRMAAALGRPVPEPIGRAFFFADDEALLRYLGRLAVMLDARFLHHSIYLGELFNNKKLLFSEGRIRARSDGGRPDFGTAIFHHLLDLSEARGHAAWVVQGLANMLSNDERPDDLARVNRRLLAGRAAGRTIGAEEFFTATGAGNWRKHDGRAELEHFAWSNQFAAQAWSMVEFLCGRGATPERRQAFQHFFNDAASRLLKKGDRHLAKRTDRGDVSSGAEPVPVSQEAGNREQPAEALERHFGCSSEELFERWQAWVNEQGSGEHHPPPPNLAAYLISGPIAKVTDPETPRRERATAIRELGQYGYLLGADALVTLLDRQDDELRAEAIWALECISGEVLGTSAAAWHDWWRRAAASTPEASPAG